MDLELDKNEIELTIELLKEKIKSNSLQMKDLVRENPRRGQMEKEVTFAADVLKKILFQVSSEIFNNNQEINS